MLIQTPKTLSSFLFFLFSSSFVHMNLIMHHQAEAHIHLNKRREEKGQLTQYATKKL